MVWIEPHFIHSAIEKRLFGTLFDKVCIPMLALSVPPTPPPTPQRTQALYIPMSLLDPTSRIPAFLPCAFPNPPLRDELRRNLKAVP